MATLIDSYSESNDNIYTQVFTGSLTRFGQSFLNTQKSKLTTVKFYLAKNTSLTGSIYAEIYAHTGTYGSGGKPTGPVLATSDALSADSLQHINSGRRLETFNFSGINQITLSPNTNYVAILYYPGGDSTHWVALGVDSTSPTHGGNASYNGGIWLASSSDVVFYVYGDLGEVISASVLSLTLSPLSVNAYSYQSSFSFPPVLPLSLSSFTPNIHTESLKNNLVGYYKLDGNVLSVLD